MAVEQIELELIDDNPHNPRKHYPQARVKEMAQSLLEVGLRQIPEGRHVDGRVQLAYGHMRKRGYLANQKKDPEHWKMMPVDVKEISDQDMFHFSMVENLTRTDITPLEVARCLESFSEMFPDVLDEDIAKKHNMTAANVSNMKRVLRLPEKILEKIDNGVISFTQGRELLTLEGLENAENLMASALGGLRTGNKTYGHANTVEGLQATIHDVIESHYCPLDKAWEGYRWDLLFDTRAAGCLQCDKMIRTHPNKSQSAHYCTDAECWDRHQEEHREKAASAAKAQMEAEVVNRAVQVIAQEEKSPVIAENTICVDLETLAKLEVSNSCERISQGEAVRKAVAFEGKLYVATSSGMGKVAAYQLVPREEFTGEVRTYRVPKGREYDEYYESLRNDPNGFYHGMLVKRGKGEHVLVGPEVTFVTKVDEGDISQEMLGEAPAASATAEKPKRKPRPVVANESGLALPLPCESCAKAETCDRSYFHVAADSSGRLVCEEKVQRPPEVLKIPTEEIPDDILTLAREKAGTRAEILDLNDICTPDQWRRQVKQGYAILDNEFSLVDDPAECLERCTHGFHYAFDSKAREQKVSHVCSDTKCLAKKKATSTRAKNAAGQARKKAEVKALREAIAQTTILDRSRIKLILLAQMDGQHCTRYYYEGSKKPETWLWEKISAGTPGIERKREDLFKRIDKLSDEELAKLVVEFMFYYLVDHGDIGSHEIKVTEPLSWMGIDIKVEPEGDRDLG